jgi:hypothetical protein
MNERVDELIFQVGFTRLHYPDDNFLDGRYALTQEQLDKFTELIVRECANIVNSLGQHEGPGDCATVEYIKEHFGVE